MKKQIPWLTAAAILVIIFGTIYGAVQQSQRSAVNSPQIQMAEDTAAALDAGQAPQSLVNPKVDMNHSLAPFVIIYDLQGNPVAGSGYLNNSLATIPVGVLKASEGKTYHTVSWQPQPDVRFASASVKAKDYYVTSGRSLKEVEKNEQLTMILAGLGLMTSLLVLALGALLSQTKRHGKST